MNYSKEYSEAVEGLDQYGPILCSLIEELLRQAGIKFQHVGYRVKSAESAVRKISLKTGSRLSLTNLTDLLGVRVITYFPHDVDKAADVIRDEFDIDEENSVDKRKLLDFDRFGYMSLHVIASLTPTRNHLAEYKRFSNTKFEVQIRSVLQHAWAEIEHDLGYKTEEAIPDEMRRSFSRLAGLLEIADEEFERIRKALGEYEKHVSETISSAPQELTIDQSTLAAALETERTLRELDELIANIDDTSLKESLDLPYIGRRASDLKLLGIKNIDQLLKTVEHYRAYVESFARHWMEELDFAHTNEPKMPFPRGAGLFYLDYVLAAQRTEVESTSWREYWKGDRIELAKEIRATWKKVVNDLGEPKLIKVPRKTKDR